MWRPFRRRHPSAELLSECMDGRLLPQRRSEVERHVSFCRPCRQELESLQSTAALLHRLPLAAPRRSFLLTGVPEPSALQRSKKPMALVPGLASAAAVALFVLVLSLDLTGSLAARGVPATTTQPGPIAATPVAVTQRADSGATEGVAAQGAEAPKAETAPKALQPGPASSEAPAAPSPRPDSNAASRGLQSAPSQDHTPVLWHALEGVLAGVALLLVAIALGRGRRGLRRR